MYENLKESWCEGSVEWESESGGEGQNSQGSEGCAKDD